ncbi:MAG: GNAT family N-acetyltransferase [Cyanobacteria bacterium M_surface_9_m1_291]|nr:GNAT family N-acetyltransferase [Cyanobacteria bacterium M_surface_9_m1_291]
MADRVAEGCSGPVGSGADLDIRQIGSLEALQSFRGLTAAALAAALARVEAPSLHQSQAPACGAWLAWGVRRDQRPIALLVGRIESGPVDAAGALTPILTIASLAVRRAWRRQGVATQLLAHVRRWATLQNCAAMAIDVPLGQPSTEALQALTSPTAGWRDAPGQLLVTVASPQAFEPLAQRLAAMARRQQHRCAWGVEPITADHWQLLRQRAVDPDLPGWARPPLLEDSVAVVDLDLQHCRVLRHGLDLVGWLLCHRPAPDLLRYTVAWVDPPWDRRGGMFALLADVMTSAHLAAGAQASSGFPIARGCFGFAQDNHAMAALCRKHFRPVASHWIETQHRVYALEPRC